VTSHGAILAWYMHGCIYLLKLDVRFHARSAFTFYHLSVITIWIVIFTNTRQKYNKFQPFQTNKMNIKSRITVWQSIIIEYVLMSKKNLPFICMWHSDKPFYRTNFDINITFYIRNRIKAPFYKFCTTEIATVRYKMGFILT
jgi:hypothetical protein